MNMNRSRGRKRAVVTAATTGGSHRLNHHVQVGQERRHGAECCRTRTRDMRQRGPVVQHARSGRAVVTESETVARVHRVHGVDSRF